MLHIASFVRAAYIELPAEIGGVRIPDINAASLDTQVRGIVESLDGLEGCIARSLVVRPVIEDGVRFSSACGDALHVAGQVLTSIRSKMASLEGVLCQLTEVAVELGREEMNQFVDVMGDIIGFGKFLENLSLLLVGVQEVFREISKAAMPELEVGCIEASCTSHFSAFRQHLDDLTSAFEEAASFHEGRRRLADLAQNIRNLVDELHGIRDEFGNGADQSLGAGDTCEVLRRFTLVWDRCQQHYISTASVGGSTQAQAIKVREAYREVLSVLSNSLGIAIVD